MPIPLFSPRFVGLLALLVLSLALLADRAAKAEFAAAVLAVLDEGGRVTLVERRE